MRAVLSLFLALTLTCVATAQVKVGDNATWPKAKSLGFTKMTSMEDAKGKLVLLEYFAYW